MESLKLQIREIIGEVTDIENLLLDTYQELLVTRNAIESDKVFNAYQKTVLNAVDGRLTNDQISYYIINFGRVLYLLQTSLARQSLASDLASLHFGGTHAVAYTGAVGEDNRKLTREDKSAIATIETTNERLVEVLYVRVTQAVESRIRSVNTILRTLETSATLNMSEAKLGRHQ